MVVFLVHRKKRGGREKTTNGMDPAWPPEIKRESEKKGKRCGGPNT